MTKVVATRNGRYQLEGNSMKQDRMVLPWAQCQQIKPSLVNGENDKYKIHEP